jgi:hypothetical protein
MNNPDGFSGVHLFLAGLGGAALGAIGMAIARPRTATPGGAVLPSGATAFPGEHGPLGNTPGQVMNPWNDQALARFLGRAGYNCQTWSAISRDQKNHEAGFFLVHGRTVREGLETSGLDASWFHAMQVQGPPFARAIDAYCLKLAIQAQNAPHAARPMPALTYR